MKGPRFLRANVRALTGVLVIGVLYGLTRPPHPGAADRAELAAPFAFDRLPLPLPAGHAMRFVRDVHPSLERISGWISSVGAAVALNDLDGNGLPDDVCHVDPRIDRVIVSPAPGTGDRYAAFLLEPGPLPYDPATMAPMGCLPLDANESGHLDLIVYYWGRTPILFLRTDEPGPPAAERFVPRELVQPIERWYTNAMTAADLDGDGHMDLIVGNYFQDGARILDATAEGRESMQHSMSRAANGGRLRFLLWADGRGGPDPAVAFREADPGFDSPRLRGWTLAAGAADLDGDLLPEVYVANDFGPDLLLHNRSEPDRLSLVPVHGRKTLTVPNSKVVGRGSFKGMGVDFGDVDGDGWLDIYVSNIASDYALHESHFLFVSTGEPDRFGEGVAPYVDRSEPLGVSRSGWGWETRLADLDNSGRLEALQATGFLKGSVNRWPELQELAMGNDELISDPRRWPRLQPGDDLSGHQHNPFFVRAADGRFYDIAPEVGLEEPYVTRGIAVADVDGDGRLDFAIANQWEGSFMYRNLAPRPGAFLGLDLRLPLRPGEPGRTVVLDGPVAASWPTRAAIGASVRVRLPDGSVRVGQVDGGSGHSGKRSHQVHLGLGDVAADVAIPVEVAWRDPAGVVRRERLRLVPGWHTVVLDGIDTGAGHDE